MNEQKNMKDLLTKERMTGILVGAIFGAIIALGIRAWFDVYGVRSPIVIKFEVIKQSMVYKKTPMPLITPTVKPKAKKVITPTPTAKPKKVSSWVDLKKIYQLESSSGRNDSCKNQGKFNGYGYGQSSFAWNCFDSFEEVTEKVAAWFGKRKVEGYTLAEALCYYNQGVKTEDCHYVQAYNSL